MQCFKIRRSTSHRTTGIRLAAMLIALTLAFGPAASVAQAKCADVVEFFINDGAKVTKSRDIVINVKFVNKATHYIICEDPEFKGCSWTNVPHYGPIKYRLSEGNGIKKIYFKAKNLTVPGKVYTATIELIDESS
jgi:hypothetical protein